MRFKLLSVYLAYLFALIHFLTGCSAATSTSNKSDPKPKDLPLELTVSTNVAKYINLQNAAAFEIFGSCGADDEVVSITSTKLSEALSANCQDQVWSKTIDFSSATDGFVDMNLQSTNSKDVKSKSLFLRVSKDTIPPTTPVLSINGGATLTKNLSVTLELRGSIPAKMTVSQSSCTNDNPETFIANKTVTLNLADQLNTFFVKYVDNAGNFSTCAQVSILHDGIAPTLTFTSPAAGSPILTSQLANFAVSGTCSEEGQPVNFSIHGTSSTQCLNGTWSKSLDLSSQPDGTINIGISQTDLAGNSAIPLTRSFSKSTASVRLTLVAPTEGSILNQYSNSALIFTGTCSANSSEVRLTGSSVAQTTCLNNSYSISVDTNSLSEGQLNFTLSHTDPFGNSAPAVNVSLAKDTSGPSLLSLAINANNSHTNSLNSTLSISASDASEMLISNSILCNTGNWEPMASSKSWTLNTSNDINTVYAKFKDASGNESACISDSIIHDNIAPTVAWSSPTEGAIINSLNQNSFLVSGTCSENSRNVQIFRGSLVGSATCTNNAWSTNLNLASLGQGTQVFSISHTDLANNLVDNIQRSFIKDSLGPSQISIVIDSGLTYTSSTNVTIQLEATDASEMYLTTDASCNSGGSWETFTSSKGFTLSAVNDENEIFVIFKDSNGNLSNCISSSITHDDQPPSWSSNPTHSNINGSITQSPLVNYQENATDSGSGVATYEYAIGTGTSGASATDIKTWTQVTGGSFTAIGLSLIDGNTYYVNMRVSDNLGATTALSSTGWVVDITAPILTISTPVNNLITTQSELAFSGTCESGYPVEISYGTDVSGDSSTTCTAGVFKTYIQMSGPTGERSITASQTDLASNRTTISTTISRFFNRSEFNGPILAMKKLSDGSTLVAGQFSAFSNSKENYLSFVNLSNGRLIEKNLGDAFNGIVYAAIELSDGSLIVGGSFTQYRGRTANRIAKIASNGNLDVNFNPESGANGFDGAVLALELNGSDVYAGGSFTKYKGISANRIAKLNQNGALDTVFSPSTNGFNSSVRAIKMTPQGLFVGGDFTTYKGVAAKYLAKLSDQGILDTVFNPASGNNGTGARVRTIVNDSSNLYIGGDFTTYRGSVANRIAKVNISTFALDTTFNPATGANGTAGAVYALALSGTDLYVGGSYTTYRGTTVNNIAKVTASSGALQTAFSTGGTIGVNSAVNAIAINGSDVYLGGNFTKVRGTPAFRIAKLGASNGAVDLNFSPTYNVNGANGAINCLTITNSGVWVGGSFTNINSGFPVHNLAKLRPDGELDEDFSVRTSIVNLNNIARTIEVASDESFVLIGGDFTTYRGSAANRIAKIDLTTGDLDLTFSPASGANGFSAGSVYAIKLSPDNLNAYIGGSFTSYRGGIANRIAKVDTSTGALNLTFNPASGSNGAGGTNTIVMAIDLDSTHLYLGGSFTTYRGTTTNRITKVDFNGVRDTSFNPASGTIGFASTVNTILVDASDVYVGGAFTTYRGTAANRFAKLNKSTGSLDTTFIGSGANSTVNHIAGNSTHLFLGGSFTTWKGLAGNYIVKVSKTDGSKDLIYNPASGANGTNSTINYIFIDGTEINSVGVFSTYRNIRHNYFFKSDLSGNIIYE